MNTAIEVTIGRATSNAFRAIWLFVLLSPPATAPLAFAESTTVSPNSFANSGASILDNYRFNGATKRTRLPKALRELSGLVALPNTQVALHTDNNSLVQTFDYGSSELNPSALVTAQFKGDFEGIAQLGDDLLLSDSHGSISRFNLLDTSTRTLFHSGFKERCVFEGLAVARAMLLLPCKYPRFAEAGEPAADDNKIYLFRQPLAVDNDPDNFDPFDTFDTGADFDVLTIDVSPILRERHLPRLRPSAIEVVNNRLLILAGKERVLLETTLTGDLINWKRLRWPRHRQAEGLTIGSDGSLVIVDEGRWRGGTVTVYQPRTARTKK